MPEISLPPIEELNKLTREKFVDALRTLFEGGARLGDSLCKQRPFSSYEDLLMQAETICGGMTEDELVEVVNSHPRLGANRATLKDVSRQSYVEQGYDKKESDAEKIARDELRRLSDEYEKTFGFRFVIFVNRRPPSELIKALLKRQKRSRQQELRAATESVFAIARDRLRKIGAG